MKKLKTKAKQLIMKNRSQPIKLNISYVKNQKIKN